MLISFSKQLAKANASLIGLSKTTWAGDKLQSQSGLLRSFIITRRKQSLSKQLTFLFLIVGVFCLQSNFSSAAELGVIGQQNSMFDTQLFQEGFSVV